jgi:hypothetical protein
MTTRIRFIIVALALSAPALFAATATAQHRREPAKAEDTQTSKDDDKKKEDKAVTRLQKEAEKAAKEAAKRRADDEKKREAADRRDRDDKNARDRDRGRNDNGDQRARPRPPQVVDHPRVVERTRVVFVGGYFYDPVFGRYPWWSPVIYPHHQVVFEGRSEVRLQVTPRAAAVYVDGFYAGIVDDFDGFFERLPLLPGGHTIALYLEGFQTITRSVYLAPGSEVRIREVLAPLPPGMLSQPPTFASALPPPPPGSYLPPHTSPVGQPAPSLQASAQAAGFGVLSIHFRPIDATLVIDGQEWISSVPGELVVHVGVGHHFLELRTNGRLLFSTEVDVREGETRELNVSAPRSTE